MPYNVLKDLPKRKGEAEGLRSFDKKLLISKHCVTILLYFNTAMHTVNNVCGRYEITELCRYGGAFLCLTLSEGQFYGS